MSIFRCAQCYNPRDADAEDHCEEAPNGIDVICGACVDAREDASPPPTPEDTKP